MAEITLQQCVLDIMRIGVCIEINQIVDLTGKNHREISNAVCPLIYKGLIGREERGCYILTKKGIEAKKNGVPITKGPAGPLKRIRRQKKKTLKSKIWAAIRTKSRNGNKFTINSLLALAQSGAEKDAYSNANNFIGQLVKTGYLREMPIREHDNIPTSNGHKRYLLLRNTGLLSPVYISAKKVMHDRNTQEVFPCKIG